MTPDPSAEFSIRTLSGIKEQDLGRTIFDEVWPSDEGTQIDEIVAPAIAFPGLDKNRHLHLHSHMAAVKERYRNRNISVKTSEVLCYLPVNIIELRTGNSALARPWRLAMRNQLQPRLDPGWHISGFTSDEAYILTQSP
jgi:predicted GNAT superfamily acetyltransferase